MAYKYAIIYVNPETGIDTVPPGLASCSFANNGSGGVRVTKVGHRLVTGSVVDITSSTSYDGAFLINVITANTFDLFTQRSTGTFTLTGIPAVNDTLTIGAQTFTFKASRSGAGEVTIGATISATIENLQTAITTDISVQTSQQTPPHNGVIILHILSGTAGNSVTFTKSCSVGTITGSGTLSGGANASYVADRTGTVTPRGGADWSEAIKFTTLATWASTKTQAGDIWRFIKSSAPTSLSQDATWTGSTFLGGAITNAAITLTTSTNTSPIVISRNSHGYSNGDRVVIYSHATNTSANGIWIVANKTLNTFELEGSVGIAAGTGGNCQQINCKTVVLTTAVNLHIDQCNVSWTPGTNVTSAIAGLGNYMKGCPWGVVVSTNASCGANQIIAKQGLSASLDLSGYEQISFYIKTPSTTVAIGSGVLKIKLYSDAACTAEVESLDIPALMTLASIDTPIVINKGSALSTTVQGIALYSTVALASKTIYLSNIIACKAASSADSLTLMSLISKNSLEVGGDHSWYPIGAIWGKVVVLLASSSSIVYPIIASTGYYYGTSETVNLYKRETTKIYYGAKTLQTDVINAAQGYGTLADYIFYSGGWSSIYIQNGLTIFDGGCMYGHGHGSSTNSQYLLSERTATVRQERGYGFGGYLQYIYIQFIMGINGIGYWTGVMNNSIIYIDYILSVGAHCFSSSNTSYGNNWTFKDLGSCYSNALLLQYENAGTVTVSKIMGCYTGGVSLSGCTALKLIFYEISYNGASIYWGMAVGTCTDIEVYGTYMRSNSTKAVFVQYATHARFFGITFVSNFGYTFLGGGIPSGEIKVFNCTTNDTYPVYGMIYNMKVSWKNSPSGIGEPMTIYYGQSIVTTESTERHTASGYAWRISLITNSHPLTYPMQFFLAKIAVNSGSILTVSIYVKFSSVDYQKSWLVIKGGMVSGVDTDQISALKTQDTNWEKLTVTCNPSENGVVEAYLYAGVIFGASNSPMKYMYFDDMEISQA